MAILTSLRWHLIVLLIYISLIIGDVERPSPFPFPTPLEYFAEMLLPEWSVSFPLYLKLQPSAAYSMCHTGNFPLSVPFFFP